MLIFRYKMFIFAARIIFKHFHTMKKLLLSLLGAALAAGVAAAGPAVALRPAFPIAGAPARAAEPMAEHDWEELGTGNYTDDILTANTFFDGIEPVTYEVRVQHDKANPGVYRIVDPWANYPNTALIEEQDAELKLGDDVYIMLDARDPQFVRLLRSPLGMSDWGGPTDVIGYSEAEGMDEDILEEQLQMHGTLADGVIRFTDVHSIGIIQADDTEPDGEYIYNANDNGAFALFLPGTAAPVDYSVTIYTEEPFCPDEADCYHVELGGDNRIASLRYMIRDHIADNAIDLFATEGIEASIGDVVTVDLSQSTARVMYLLVAAYDAEGVMQNAIYGEYDTPDSNNDEWVAIGKGKMTEGLLSCLALSPFTSETFEVDVEENKYLKGYYRLKNPYDSWNQSSFYTVAHTHNHYLYVNAYDPDEVFIEYSPIGLDVSAFGELAVSSDYFALVETYGRDVPKQYDIHSGGTMKDNVITFNNRNDIRVLCYDLGKWFYTNRLENPDYSKDAADAAEAAGEQYDVEPYIAGPFCLDLTDCLGITGIESDATDAEPVYYNLQGRRVVNPAPGVAIRVIGALAEKVIVK